MEKELSGLGGVGDRKKHHHNPFDQIFLTLTFSRARRADAAREGDKDKTGWRQSIYYST